MSDDSFTDRYLIQGKLVEREYATRSVAIDRILGREVVITQLRGRIGRRAAVQQAFRAAAEQARRLSHNHIVALFETGASNGLPYAVQEYSHSESLVEIIEHEGPFHPDDVAILIEQIAEALDYAQQRGVTHLAVRPENIVVDYDGIALLSDFGIGHALDDIAELSISVAPYRAPERSEGSTGDARADVFSLGVIAYQMLTDALPFEGETAEQILEQMQNGTPLAPSVVLPEVPPALSGVVLSALSAVPQHRYQTAGEFAHALTNWRDARIDPRTQRLGTDSGFGSTIEVARPASVDTAAAEPDDGDEPPRNQMTAILAWAAVAIGVFALGWIAFSVLDSRSNGDDPAITRVAGNAGPFSTPVVDGSPTAPAGVFPTAVSLIGLSMGDAGSETDIPIRQVATETSETIPEGQILRQSPNPGSPIRNNEIVVVVSGGTGPIQLADLDVANKPFDQAAETLTAMGLNVSSIDEGNANVPDGLVIRIDERTAEPGDTVHLVVSKGDRVQIPLDLQSQPVDDVVDRLAQLGLDVQEPIPVSGDRITQQGVDIQNFDIVDGDVVGIQEPDSSFGAWVDTGSEITPVYYDQDL